MKVVLKALGALALLAVVGAGAAVFLLARGGTNLDDWLARQVTTIANYYLVPEIGFERFTYEAPGTLRLANATLTAPDGTVVVDAAEIVVTLARTPRMGEPIEIERVRLVRPQVNLLQEAGGGFKGLAPFVRTQRVREQDRAPRETKLSEVLRIRNLTMVDGGVVFAPVDQPAMTLSGLTMDLDIEPANEAGEAGAWYAVAARANRAPVFDVMIDGRFDVDNLVADLGTFSFETTLDEHSYGALPPALQSLLRERDARGNLFIDARGVIPVRDLNAADFTATLRLDEFNVAQGEYRLPIEIASIDASLKGGRATITGAFANMLGGRVLLPSATVNLADASRPATATWKVEGVDLQQLLRARPTNSPPKIAGILHGEGGVSGQGAAFMHTIDGWGTVALRDGRLVQIPVITDVMRTLKVLDRLTGRGDFTDEADVEFDLSPEGMTITRLSVTTQVAAVRGAQSPVGTITYDGAMDLLVAAGPLEKLQGMLGRVGEALGRITDQLATYRVHGPVSDPKVSVRVLGIGGK